MSHKDNKALFARLGGGKDEARLAGALAGNRLEREVSQGRRAALCSWPQASKGLWTAVAFKLESTDAVRCKPAPLQMEVSLPNNDPPK